MEEFFQFASVLSTTFALIGVLLLVIVHGVLAQAAVNDVDRMHEDGREARLMGATGWGLVVLVTGLLGIAFYWAVHHSNLRDPSSDRRLQGRGTPWP